MFSRQVRRMIIPEERLLPHLGSPPNKENRDPRMASKEAPVLEDFNTSEVLLKYLVSKVEGDGVRSGVQGKSP